VQCLSHNSNITDIAPMTRLQHQPQHCAMFITQQWCIYRIKYL